MLSNVYVLSTPVAWALPPEIFSFSILKKIEKCPRQWQLLNSDWGNGQKFPLRQHPKTIEGIIIHKALDMLTRALCQMGRPPIGSREFQEILENCGFWTFFEGQIEIWNERLSTHPKAAPFYMLRTNPRDIANLVIRLFRQQYRPGNSLKISKYKNISKSKPSKLGLMDLLEGHGALSEVRLRHPSLPLVGNLDMVTLEKDGSVCIVDYKSGELHPSQEEQLVTYGVLWWRCSGVAPAIGTLQYIGDHRTIEIDEAKLQAYEKEIAKRIKCIRELLAVRPARPLLSNDCGTCAVRARCDEGWFGYQQTGKKKVAGNIDLEVIAKEDLSTNGFLGRERDGDEVAVVFEASMLKGLPPIYQSGLYRIIDGVVKEGGAQIEIKPWTEVYKL